MRVCERCGKGPKRGNAATYRGMLKKHGGVGRKTVRTSIRRFLPNIQRKTLVLNGTVRRIRVCASCLKSPGLLTLLQRKAARPST